jgi:phospholipase C
MAACVMTPALAWAQHPTAPLDAIQTIVVIYAENRSFDNLYSNFPGANGLQSVTGAPATQIDRDGQPFKELPPVWDGLTAKGITPVITQTQTEHLPNAPFRIDDPNGFNTHLDVTTHDLWHRFYQNQMQIDGGRNDRFVAYADSGSLVMGHYDGSGLPLYKIAQQYVLADNFFMGAFGGSFLNHFWLICACTPVYPNADKSQAKPSISVVDPDGVTLTRAANAPASAVNGVPKFVSDGSLTPDLFAVNTMQPPYQPSANKPVAGGIQPWPTLGPRPYCHRSMSRRSVTSSALTASVGPGMLARGRPRLTARAPGRHPTSNSTTSLSTTSSITRPERRHGQSI